MLKIAMVLVPVLLFASSPGAFGQDQSVDDWVTDSGITFLTGGKVGIGTASPLSKLDVVTDTVPEGRNG